MKKIEYPEKVCPDVKIFVRHLQICCKPYTIICKAAQKER